MKLLVQDPKSGVVRLEDVPAPTARAGGVVVSTRASLVSAGTERHTVAFGQAGLLEKARSRPDLVAQVVNRVRTDGVVAAYKAAQGRLEEWIPLGYSSSGVVVSVGAGVTRLREGDRVACAGQGYASHGEFVWVPENFVAALPPAVAHEDGAFATLGAIALHGIHRAGVAPGERVGVLGLGLLGQLTVQMLVAYGCVVFGVDVRKDAVAHAIGSGAAAGAVSGAEDVEGAVAALTGGVGLDAVIVTAATPSSEPLQTASRLARRRGRVCVVGLVGMEADRRVFYEKELDLVVAKSYGPGRDDPWHERKGFDYPLELSRWTVRRNMEEFLRLVGLGRVIPRHLVAERVPLDAAPAAYDRLVAGAVTGGTILIDYPGAGETKPVPRVAFAPVAPVPSVAIPGVALVGAGAFARSVLLPALEAAGPLERRLVVSAGGMHSAQAARKFGFTAAATETKEALEDPGVHALLIATRHDLHARLAAEALEAGKSVFVEKPLAITEEDLAGVARAARSSRGRLLVGFNRRFAPLVVEARRHFEGRSGPLLMTYRVNAGALPASHWTRDAEEGGGRILGETCHFVDTLASLAGAQPVRVYATGGAGGVAAEDHLAVALDFADGSRATLLYSGTGPPGLPKERIEVLGAGKAAVVDNFRALELTSGMRTTRRRALRQDKGHAAELAAFFDAVRTGGPSPVPLDDLLASSLATLAIPRSLAAGAPVDVSLASLAEGGA